MRLSVVKQLVEGSTSVTPATPHGRLRYDIHARFGAGAPAGCPQLDARPFGKRCGADGVEDLVGAAELIAGVTPAPHVVGGGLDQLSGLRFPAAEDGQGQGAVRRDAVRGGAPHHGCYQDGYQPAGHDYQRLRM